MKKNKMKSTKGKKRSIYIFYEYDGMKGNMRDNIIVASMISG